MVLLTRMVGWIAFLAGGVFALIVTVVEPVGAVPPLVLPTNTVIVSVPAFDGV